MRSIAAARATAALCLFLLSVAHARDAHAWGATGHELVSGSAFASLPDEVPAFLRTRSSIDQGALLGRELDRSRGAGRVHDSERDPGHFISVGDDGKIEGLISLNALPPTRADFNAALIAAGKTPADAGYLPYAIIDGWQQIVKDFAYWRASRIGAVTAASAADRRWFAADVRLREMLTLRDIGVWSHYIGDASQPMHVSVHYNGWDAYPDPIASYPANVRGVHAFFEGVFVRDHVRRGDVAAAMRPYLDCHCAIEARVARYLTASNAEIVPLYQLVHAGAFRDATPDAIRFATERLAAGAQETRDLIVDAWHASASASVGYPAINVSDIESRRVTLSRAMYGDD